MVYIGDHISHLKVGNHDSFSALEMFRYPQPSRDLLTIVGETFVVLRLAFPRQVMIMWNQAWKYEVISQRKGFGEERNSIPEGWHHPFFVYFFRSRGF